jgi:penicillin amidase
LTPVYFEEWFRKFYEKTWDELEGQENILYPSHWRTVYIMRDLPDSDFFDIKSTPKRETIADIITIAFQEMVTEMTERIALEPDLNWSNYRNTKVSHLARIDAFSRENVYTDGYAKSLNAVTSRTGPSWRMVVEMGEIPTAKVVYPGGQSGNPGSKYYDDFLDEWAEGKYFDALYLQSPEEGSDRIYFTQKFQKSVSN